MIGFYGQPANHAGLEWASLQNRAVDRFHAMFDRAHRLYGVPQPEETMEGAVILKISDFVRALEEFTPGDHLKSSATVETPPTAANVHRHSAARTRSDQVVTPSITTHLNTSSGDDVRYCLKNIIRANQREGISVTLRMVVLGSGRVRVAFETEDKDLARLVRDIAEKGDEAVRRRTKVNRDGSVTFFDMADLVNCINAYAPGSLLAAPTTRSSASRGA